MSICSRLSGVPEQFSAIVPGRDPDRLIKWFIGVVVIASGVNLLNSFVVAQKWAWLPPAVFVAALLVAVPLTGLLRRERYGTTRARALPLFALTGYLAVTVWGSVKSRRCSAALGVAGRIDFRGRRARAARRCGAARRCRAPIPS